MLHGVTNFNLHVVLILTVLVFYACSIDELDKAKKKLKLVEDTSDIQTEEENYISKPPKRKTKKTSRYISSSDDNDDEKGCEFPRPPPLKKHLSNCNYTG